MGEGHFFSDDSEIQKALIMGILIWLFLEKLCGESFRPFLLVSWLLATLGGTRLLCVSFYSLTLFSRGVLPVCLCILSFLKGLLTPELEP